MKKSGVSADQSVVEIITRRLGFTLVELLVVLVIFGTLVGLLLPGCHYVMNMNNKKNEIFKCVKTYTEVNGSAEKTKTNLVVNLRPLKGHEVKVFYCEDKMVFAQFEAGEYYEVSHGSFLGDNYVYSANYIEKTVVENGEAIP